MITAIIWVFNNVFSAESLTSYKKQQNKEQQGRTAETINNAMVSYNFQWLKSKLHYI